MDVLRSAISYIGARDPEAYTKNSDHIRRSFQELMAKLSTVVALDFRRRRGQDFVEPSTKKGFSENFLDMVFGEGVCDRADVEAFDRSMIFYVEHSFNASTFTARVVTSTMSDTYSAVTAAIGALKGPVHGGATEAVMHTMLEIGDPDKALEWVNAALDDKQLIMGFGHRL